MSDVVLAQALYLRSLGLPVLWLRPRDKAPIQKLWRIAPFPSESRLRESYREGFNLGIRTGAIAGAPVCVVAVDLDSTEALSWALRELPVPTLRTKTSKGEHWLFRLPADCGKIGNRAHIKIDGKTSAIDLRGDGGQVVCAPSVHPSGFEYVQLGNWNAWGVSNLVTFDPSWFPSCVVPPVAIPASSQSPNVTDRGWRRAVGFLARVVAKGELPERGSGQGTKVFSLARICLSEFGLSESETFVVLAQHYNPYSPQPYDERSLRRKVQEAATKGYTATLRYGGAA